nr:MAG TPA: hypothetical protein [Caudoviricetes sp.]
MSAIKSAMADLTYFIEAKQRYKTLLAAKGRNVAGVEAEIATMEAIRDWVEYSEQQQDYYAHRCFAAERELKFLQRYKEIAVGVSAARRWFTKNKKWQFVKLLQMVEDNPCYFEFLMNTEEVYSDEWTFLLKLLEKKDPEKCKNMNLYRELCKKAGLEPERRILQWREKRKREIEQSDMDKWLNDMVQDETFLAKLQKLIPELYDCIQKAYL